MPIRQIFFNETERRLRAGWRLFGFIFIFGALNAGVTLLLKSLIGSLPKDKTTSALLLGAALVSTSAVAVYLSRRFLDRKPFLSLGLLKKQGNMADLIFGFLLSGFMVGVVFLALVSFGWLNVRGTAWPDNQISGWLQLLLLFIGVGAMIGWWEELVFRGYILQNLIDGLGSTWAIGLSCVFYGIIHLLNPNANLFSGLIIAFIGYLRIFGWLRTGQLWLSMGMHAGWNFFQGPVFGFSVSGRDTFSILKHETTGPGWITGGVFGPEAGFVSIPVVLFGLLVMFLWTRKRNVVPYGPIAGQTNPPAQGLEQ